MKKEKKNHQIKEQVVNVLSLPQDLVLGKAILSFIGNTEVYIENYKGILKYNCNEIKIETKSGVIEIKGKDICVDYYAFDEMRIIGKIQEVKFD